MQTDMHYGLTLLGAYVFLALFFSFLCSVAEAVLLSITPSFIEDQKEKHPRRAALLKALKQDNVDRSLAAILTLNTIAHTVGAIGAGAQATVVFGSAWFGVFSAVMTLMILFLSEVLPKTLGAVYWSKLAGPTAYYVKGLIIVLYPIVRLSEKFTKLFSRGQAVHVFSRDEFVAMARVGEQAGQIAGTEARMIRNLFRFGSIEVTDIMTPRIVISALPEDITIAEGLASIEQKPFSRLPLYQDDIDDVTGFVLKDDVLLRIAQGRGHEPLASLKRAMLIVPETVSLSRLLETLLKDRHHIALVVDEYGGTAGLVTLEDLVETLTGMEITDEKDAVVDMRALARRQWKERARVMGLDVDRLQQENTKPASASDPERRET
ncbi:MAG TPA: hemolysin family protein [Smithellaceae bacterium]|nr:hemolysin family protein [Smithellaceae bacterium]